MGLETATYIDDLNSANPEPTDLRRQGDDHLRLIKEVLQSTFPRADRPFRFPQVIEKTATATIAANELNSLIECDATAAAMQINLPVGLATSNAGHRVTLIKTDSSGNAVTVAPASGTINGEASFTLVRQYESMTLEWSGTEWFALRDLTVTQTFKTITADATITIDDLEKTIICTPAAADMTITLPAVSACTGRMVRFKRVSATYKTTIDGAGANKIDNQNTIVLESNYDDLILLSSGSEWLIFNRGPSANATEVAAFSATSKSVSPATLYSGIIGQGSDIASAATIAIGNGGYFVITGTTNITAINFTADMVGRRVLLKIETSQVRIAHGASLITPTSQTITLRADEIIEVLCDEGSVARIIAVYRSGIEQRFPDAILEDQKVSGTPGGTFNNGAPRKRDLNTEVRNVGGFVTLASNEFTLAIGRYYVEWDAPAQGVNLHQSLLYNETDVSVVAYGLSTRATSSAATVSSGSAALNITAAKAFSIRHECQTTAADTGFGDDCGFGTEVYTRVRIWRGI